MAKKQELSRRKEGAESYGHKSGGGGAPNNGHPVDGFLA